MAAVVSSLMESSPWRLEQYRTMLRLICESDYAAVTETDACQKLTPGGDQAVQAMVTANLLSYRPPSGVWRQALSEETSPHQCRLQSA